MTTMTNLKTMKEAAQLTGYQYSTLRVIAHKGEFIEPDLVIGSSQLFKPKRLKAWKAARERAKRERAANR